MPERPHSRKVKIAEGTAEVKKGEKISSEARASERKTPDTQSEKQTENGEK